MQKAEDSQYFIHLQGLNSLVWFLKHIIYSLAYLFIDKPRLIAHSFYKKIV